jgi:hypothetical protein
MFSLELQAGQEDRDLLIAELWEAGSSGILETERGLRAFFEDDRQAAGLCDIASRVCMRPRNCASKPPNGS